MCADCNNELTQPFCGVTGRPHVQNNPAANADSKPFSSEQFSSDRACTQCGDGMLEDEAQQAVYVCLDCDAKLCEVCWDHEHRNKKRSGHAQHILYFDCDLCPFGDNPSSPRPALWFCDVCRLLLCKQCWFNEHKNRGRRSHQSQFLYPGGESGPHAASTIDAQTLEVPAGNFDITPFGGFVKDPSERICTICNGAEGSAAYFCIECDLHNPERLCGNCWATEHRMPHRRGHVKKVMMYECDVCLDHEHRAASVICRTCNLKLCRQCLDIEHRNPQRHGHATETLYNDIQDPEARRLIDTVAIVGDGIPSQQTALLPAHPSPGVGAVYPTDLALVNYPFMPAHLVSASPPRILTPQGGAASPPLFVCIFWFLRVFLGGEGTMGIQFELFKRKVVFQQKNKTKPITAYVALPLRQPCVHSTKRIRQSRDDIRRAQNLHALPPQAGTVLPGVQPTKAACRG